MNKENITKDIRTILENSLRKGLIEFLACNLSNDLYDTTMDKIHSPIQLNESLRIVLYDKLL